MSQTNYSLVIVKINQTRFYKIDSVKLKDSTEVIKYLNRFLQTKFDSGFFTAQFDNVKFTKNNSTAFFVAGKKYKFGKINFIKSDLESDKNFKSIIQKWSNKILNVESYRKFCNEIIKSAENTGHPFATITPVDFQFSNDSINFTIQVEKKNRIKIDSIFLKGNATISQNYLRNQLQIKTNDLYSEEKILAIKNSLSKCSFLSLAKPTEVEFHQNDADIYIYANNRKASQFDGIAGFASGQNQTVTLTGEVKLNLVNYFAHGETLAAGWDKKDSYSQNLNVAFSYPYIFNSTVGIDCAVNIIKRDTSWISADASGALDFQLAGNLILKTFFKTSRSASISAQQQSNVGNYSSLFYGAGLQSEKFDNIYNPRRGYSFDVSFAAGSRQTDAGNTTQTKTDADINFYQPLFKQFVLHYKQLDGLISGTQLYDNEMYLLGGFHTIRGYDEKSFKASKYHISTVELRLLFGEMSSIFLFSDMAYLWRPATSTSQQNFLSGFGIGLSFETKAGIFNMAYAYGKQNTTNYDLNSAKIHFGYASRF